MVSLGTSMPTNKRDSDGRNLLQCDICRKIFSNKRNRKQHMITHESDPDLKARLKCEVCGRKFTWQGDLKRHMLTHESDPDKKNLFKCDDCGKKFSQRSNLSRHMLTCKPDAGKRSPLECHISGKIFKQGRSMKTHVLTQHESNPPLKCTMQLPWQEENRVQHGANNSTLAKHSKANKNNSSKCTICNKRFTRKSEQVWHYEFNIHTFDL